MVGEPGEGIACDQNRYSTADQLPSASHIRDKYDVSAAHRAAVRWI